MTISIDVGINVAQHDIYRWDMLSPSLTDADFQRIKSWGLKSIQITFDWNIIEPQKGVYDYNLLSRLDTVVNRIITAGLKCILKPGISPWFAKNGGNMQDPPNGTPGWLSSELFWSDPVIQERFYVLWEFIVTRYAGKLSAAALMNEPVCGTDEPVGGWTEAEKQATVYRWNNGELSDPAITRIRALDPDLPIMMTMGPWGSPDAYIGFGPRPFSNIIYAFSWYMPGSVTHYGAEWTGDQQELRYSLGNILAFRDQYQVPIFAQELGINVTDYPPTASRLKWVDDSLKVLNDEGIRWFYHDFIHYIGVTQFSVIDSATGVDRPTVPVIMANIPTPLPPTPAPAGFPLWIIPVVLFGLGVTYVLAKS